MMMEAFKINFTQLNWTVQSQYTRN